MARKKQERRKFHEERWPLLWNLMCCYFNEDFAQLYGSLDGAITAAVRDGSQDHRRALLKEWRDWNFLEGPVRDIRPSLHDGFGIAVRFEGPMEARYLMNRIYDGLMETVRAETHHNAS